MAFDVGASSSARVRPQMNVTPLVDVVLVLLIIFMVITPLLSKQIWISVPEKDNGAVAQTPEDNMPVVVTLKRNSLLSLSDEPIARAELARRIKSLMEARRDRTVFFDAEDGVDYGQTAEVIDVLHKNGAEHIAVVPQPLPADE